MVTPAEILQKLTAAGIEYELLEQHAVTTTAEAQINELQGKLDGTVIKNVFLKDKKGRLYLISLLTTTKMQLKEFGARVGVGKSGISMAPEALIGEVLKVPLASVTPLALVHPEADKVCLFLDHRIKEQSRVIVHPLVNTSSIALTPAGLEAALGLFGRQAVYVDLELEPVIDKDHGPDLMDLRETAVGPTAAAPVEVAAAAAAPPSTKPSPPAGEPAGPSAPAKAAAPAAPKNAAQQQKGTGGKAGGSGQKPQRQQLEVQDVAARTEDIIKLVTSALGSSSAVADLDSFVQRRLRADIEMQLNALRNAAFVSGYTAGKGELVAAAKRTYA